MQVPYDAACHEPLADREWRLARARDAIAVICRDAEAALTATASGRCIPATTEPGTAGDGILRGLYVGAVGMLHALGRLADAGLHVPTLDRAAIVDALHEAALASPDQDGAGASLLVGSSGILLAAHRLAPSAATADAITANAEHPSNELLLGAPGTMLAARVMHARTGEARFAELWRRSARTLLARWEIDDLWTQDLYGDRLRFDGAGHGFAGNVLALHGAPAVARQRHGGRGAGRRHDARARDRPWDDRELTRDDSKQRLVISRAWFPDLRFELDEMVAIGDRVALSWTMRGKQTDALAERPASGRPIEARGMTIYYIAAGRITGHRQVVDRLAVAQQLGFVG